MKFIKIPDWQYLLLPSALFVLGFLMNAVVIALNGGQMPVHWPAGCQALIADNLASSDVIHSCLTHVTHLKILSDWILFRPFGMTSPGDYLMWQWDYSFYPALVAWTVLQIKHANKLS